MKTNMSYLNILLLLGASLVFSNALAQNAPVGGRAVDYSRMRLVWNDEFEGEKIDTTKWNYRDEGKKRCYGVVDRRAVELDGKGHVSLKVLKDEKTGTYYIAELGTEGLFAQRYGYFECRAKVNRQKGAHVAFWLQSPTIHELGTPREKGTEIDVFEYHRASENIVHHNLHWNGYQEHHRSTGFEYVYPAVKDGFHVFGMEWTPEKYVFYVDGRKTWETSTAVSHIPEYLILSTELTGWGGDPSEGSYPDAVVFDYVRVYEFVE